MNCPICKTGRTKLIFEKKGCNFNKCRACGLVFIWPQPEAEEIKDMYQRWGESYYLSKDKIDIDFNSSFEERLKQVEPFRKNNRILDVGCSVGAFLSAARVKGWDTYGVEISRPSADYARGTRKLNVFCGTLKEAGIADGHFDAVNIWAVIEHVSDPLDMLRESNRILRKGGLLTFNAPNFNSLPIAVLGRNYRYICEGRLFYFTRKSIRNLLHASGFNIINMHSEYFSPLSFIEDLRGIIPDTLKTQKHERELMKRVKTEGVRFFIVKPFWKTAMFLIRNLNLGEELRVLARRK